MEETTTDGNADKNEETIKPETTQPTVKKVATTRKAPTRRPINKISTNENEILKEVIVSKENADTPRVEEKYTIKEEFYLENNDFEIVKLEKKTIKKLEKMSEKIKEQEKKAKDKAKQKKIKEKKKKKDKKKKKKKK